MSGKKLTIFLALTCSSFSLPAISQPQFAQTQVAQAPTSQVPSIDVQTPQKTRARKEGAAMQKPDSPAPNPTAVTYPGMTRYVDLKGFFSVLMRGSPDMSGQFELASGVKYTCVSEKDKEGTRSVCFADVQEIGSPPYDSKKQSAVIQQQTNAYIEKIHGKMNSLKAHAKFGYQFRDISGRIEGADPKVKFRLNAYLSGKRMFIVAVEGKDEWVKSPQAEAFLTSFEIPGATSVPKLKVE